MGLLYISAVTPSYDRHAQPRTSNMGFRPLVSSQVDTSMDTGSAPGPWSRGPEFSAPLGGERGPAKGPAALTRSTSIGGGGVWGASPLTSGIISSTPLYNVLAALIKVHKQEVVAAFSTPVIFGEEGLAEAGQTRCVAFCVLRFPLV